VPAPDLVIFDCDGVLVDSEVISNAVLADALTHAGIPTTAAESHTRYRGMLLSDIAADVDSRTGSRLPDGFWDRYERDRATAFRLSLEPVDGAVETVTAVKAAGHAVCVASQGKRAKTELTLSLTGLRGLFADDALFSAYEVARGKPFPDLFLYAAAKMRIRPEDCVVVEDTLIGVRAAMAAGMHPIALAADGDRASALDIGARTIDKLAELPDLLRSLA
jgi:HAD superfamily hydrolase (TIGR01509 family)